MTKKMKVIVGLITFTSLFFSSAVGTRAQNMPTAAQTLDRLRGQFHEVQMEEASLQFLAG